MRQSSATYEPNLPSAKWASLGQTGAFFKCPLLSLVESSLHYLDAWLLWVTTALRLFTLASTEDSKLLTTTH
jgi:hypothetical protein